MSHSKKNKQVHPNEGGITVLEPQTDSPPNIMPFEDPSGGAVVQVSTDLVAPIVTNWQRGKQVTAVWSKNENRNSWVAIAGSGWKKLSNTSDSANIALTILASQALQSTRKIDYLEESDGMIHEIYLW